MGQARSVADSAIAKASWRIIPFLGLGYLCAYLDRINVSFAATQMNVDLGFSATVYGLGGGLFFLTGAGLAFRTVRGRGRRDRLEAGRS